MMSNPMESGVPGKGPESPKVESPRTEEEKKLALDSLRNEKNNIVKLMEEMRGKVPETDYIFIKAYGESKKIDDEIAKLNPFKQQIEDGEDAISAYYDLSKAEAEKTTTESAPDFSQVIMEDLDDKNIKDKIEEGEDAISGYYDLSKAERSGKVEPEPSVDIPRVNAEEGSPETVESKPEEVVVETREDLESSEPGLDESTESIDPDGRREPVVGSSEVPVSTPEASPFSALLNTENRAKFERMTGNAKKIFGQAHEGLFNIPVVNRLVGKLEIAYNQFWSDRHQEKSAQLKTEMGAIDEQIRAIEQEKADIQREIADMKAQNSPGVEQMQLMIEKFNRQQESLLNKKGKLQTKLESRDNKVSNYTNERDVIAEKLIGRYEEKLLPMEKGLERLQANKDQLDLEAAVAEVRFRELQDKITEQEQKIQKAEERASRTGISNKGLITIFQAQVAENYKKLRAGQEVFNRRYAELNKQIAKLDAKANPYRDKRAEFVRVKNRRPVDMNIETRSKEVERFGREEVTATTRMDTVFESVPSEPTPESSIGTVENEKKGPQVSELVPEWNAYLKEKYKDIPQEGIIDLQDFVKSTKLRLDQELNLKEFKKIITMYAKIRKIPTEKLAKDMDGFIEAKIKNAK